MKKIRLFSTTMVKEIEGSEAELYVNFYLALSKDYIFTFIINAPNLACSGRNPIKLWKHFLILFEEEYVKYLRRYEKRMHLDLQSVKPQELKIGHWIKYGIPRCGEQHYKCSLCGYYIIFGQWGKLYTKEFKFCPACGERLNGLQENGE